MGNTALYIDAYCQGCEKIEPVVEIINFETWEGSYIKNIKVVCANSARCAAIYEQLKKEYEEKQGGAADNAN